MRSTSATFLTAITARETKSIFVVLLTLDSDDLAEPLRVSTDNKDTFTYEGDTVRGTISRGENYIHLPMDIVLAADSDDSPPTIKISIDNVSRTIIYAIRSLSSPPDITVEVVLASSPGVVEVSLEDFKLHIAEYDAITISGTLTIEHFLNEPFPGMSILPSNFPGYF